MPMQQNKSVRCFAQTLWLPETTLAGVYTCAQLVRCTLTSLAGQVLSTIQELFLSIHQHPGMLMLWQKISTFTSEHPRVIGKDYPYFILKCSCASCDLPSHRTNASRPFTLALRSTFSWTIPHSDGELIFSLRVLLPLYANHFRVLEQCLQLILFLVRTFRLPDHCHTTR